MPVRSCLWRPVLEDNGPWDHGHPDNGRKANGRGCAPHRTPLYREVGDRERTPRPAKSRGHGLRTICFKQGDSMFVNVNSHPGSRPKVLGELGELSRARVILSEFKYSKGAEVFGEAERAEYIYQVVDGAIRSYKLLSDGRRQIGAFHMRGDIFGLENGDFHRFTAEAIV